MGQPSRLLIVDDEPDFLESITFWLTSKGFQVTTVTSGADALTLMKQKRPDAVFLDVQMPQMDGIETLRRIRILSKELPVILIMAGRVDENQLAGAKALGISGVFPKTESLDRLAQLLEVALRAPIRSTPSRKA